MKIIFDSEEEKNFFFSKLLCPSTLGLKNNSTCKDESYYCIKCWEQSGLEYEIKKEVK